MMQTWTELFGHETEAIVGSPDSYWEATHEFATFAEDLDLVMADLRGAVAPGPGFEGVAADAFAALTGTVLEQLAPIVDPLVKIVAALEHHGDQLADLVVEAERELATANERQRRLRTLQLRVDEAKADLEAAEVNIVSGTDNLAAAADLQMAENLRRDAEDELDLSRRTYDQLRSDESDLNARTARVLYENPIPAFVPGNLSLHQLATPGPADVSTVWQPLRAVLLDAGVDVALPASAPDTHGEGCVWIDTDGRKRIQVGGPRGGAYVVGSDLSPGVFAVVLSLLDGWLPADRSWASVDELTEAEYSALNWAFNSNFGLGEAGQLHMVGTNGQFQNFIEGGDYTPQAIYPMDGIELAISLAPIPSRTVGTAAGLGLRVLLSDLRNLDPSPATCDDHVGAEPNGALPAGRH